jgi:choline dehydrogenase-like flavoprotein
MIIDTPRRDRAYDVIVVGAGLGGSTLAHRLAGRGVRVLVVEQGDFLPSATLPAGAPVGRSIKEFPPGQNVGGFSKFYGAAMYRLREHDFRASTHEAGESPAWPITYADLEPYYCDVERLYRVHGSPASWVDARKSCSRSRYIAAP